MYYYAVIGLIQNPGPAREIMGPLERIFLCPFIPVPPSIIFVCTI